MNNPVLIVERPDEATAVLTLNRPERRNALTIELMESLCEALESLAGEPQRRVVILRGAGPAFCAGLDLHEAAETDIAERERPVGRPDVSGRRRPARWSPSRPFTERPTRAGPA